MHQNNSWVILGGGAVVTEYYLPAFSYMGSLENLIIVEPSSKAAAQIKAAYPMVRVEQVSFQDYFANQPEKASFCIITLPNYLHTLALEYCAKEGIPALCEKPLTLSLKEVDAIEELFRSKGITCGIAMVRRFMPSFQALKKALKQGLLGEIQAINIADGAPFAWVADSYAFFDPRNGGVLADMGVHYLDLLLDLLGNSFSPVSYEHDAEGGVEANCELKLSYNETVPISLALSRTRLLKNQFEVLGSNGRLYILKSDFEKAYFEDHQGLTHVLSLQQPFSDPLLPHTFEACFVQQLMLFQESAINGKQYCVTPQDAYLPTNIIHWAYGQHPSVRENSGSKEYWISGATGFIGTQLVKHLIQTGIEGITAPLRSYRTFAELGRFGLTAPRLNLLDYDAVLESIKGHRYIVHLAYADGQDAYDINVKGTQNVVRAAYACKAEAIVVLSTMYVYGHPDTNQLVNESWTYHPAGGEYGRTKKIMQKWCLEWARQHHDTRLVILNPSCVFGPDGKTYTKLPLDFTLNNRFCWIDDGAGVANYVFISNLIDAILLALNSKKAHGQNYIISDGFCSWKEFITPLLLDKSTSIPSLSSAELLNLSFKKRTSTKDLLRFLLANYEFVELINRHRFLGKIKMFLFKSLPRFRNRLDGERGKVFDYGKIVVHKSHQKAFNPPRWLVDLFGKTTTKFSAQKARKELNWESKISFDEAMKITREWLKTNFSYTKN